MTKILVLLPIWKREKITRICLDNLQELQKTRSIKVLTIVSEKWAKFASFSYGFDFVEAQNEDLGKKMNKGIERALTMNFDYLMNLGSDDIITKELFEMYKPYFEEKKPLFGCSKVTFIDSDTKEAKTKDYKTMMGAGRCIRKDILQKYVGKGLYDNGIKGGLDTNSLQKFSCTHEIIENDPALIIDIKSDVNIWHYNETKGEDITFDRACNLLNPSQIDKILEL